jgi:drug/metabolite transporter (DMT)-like permease
MRPTDIVLAVGMLLFGTINTIASKYQDTFEVKGLANDKPHKFNHPAVQTLSMFLGETLCLIAFFVSSRISKTRAHYDALDGPPKTKFPIWTFLIPSMCDMTGSTLMYIGLLLTYPSVYQMLRGMIVVFTGVFSRIFLKRVLHPHHYLGMLSIIIGTIMVGLSSVLYGSHDKATNPLLGDVLVVIAQLVAATQMVVEEKFVGKYNVPPLQVVGNEGAWGVIVTTLLLFVLYWIPPVRKVDNSVDAVLQIYHGHLLLVALLASIFSIAFFNYFGISVTKQLSATHRTTIDATRVFLVWIFSLIVGWEQFHWLQLAGFVVLLFGTALFNEIFRLPFLRYPPKALAVNDAEDQSLLKNGN